MKFPSWGKSKPTQQVTTASPEPNLPRVTASYTTLYTPKPASTDTPYVSKFHEDLESDENNPNLASRTPQNVHGKDTAQLPEGSSSHNPTPRANDNFYDDPQHNASTSTLASNHTARTHQSSFSASPNRTSSRQSTPGSASPSTGNTSKARSKLGSSWVITDGEPVDDDWDVCGDAERMTARNMERASRNTHNSRMREALLGHGKGPRVRARGGSEPQGR